MLLKSSVYRYLLVRLMAIYCLMALLTAAVFCGWQYSNHYNASVEQAELDMAKLATLLTITSTEAASVSYLKAYFRNQESPYTIKKLTLVAGGQTLVELSSVGPDQALLEFNRSLNLVSDDAAVLSLFVSVPKLFFDGPSYLATFVLALMVQLALYAALLSIFLFKKLRLVSDGFIGKVEQLSQSQMELTEEDINQTAFIEGRLLLAQVNHTVKKLRQSRSQFVRTNNELALESEQQIAALEQENLELKAFNKKLSFLANTDSLTLVYNRTRFDLLFQENVEVANRRGTQLSLLIIDLDDFKLVNDQYGHQVGDQVLQETAHLFSSLVADQGIVARWGGEEFAILLPYFDLPKASLLAEQLRHALELQQVGAHNIGITLSVGVANKLPDESSDSLLTRADSALYHAKNQGRNQVVLAALATESSHSTNPA